MTAAPKKTIPTGLARIRKALPPPGKVFKSKKRKRRKQAKEDLRAELKEIAPSKAS